MRVQVKNCLWSLGFSLGLLTCYVYIINCNLDSTNLRQVLWTVHIKHITSFMKCMTVNEYHRSNSFTNPAEEKETSIIAYKFKNFVSYKRKLH